MRAVSASYRAWGSSVTITRPLAGGSTLALRDRKLEVLHRPGHSPSDTVFWDADRRILLGGDHLIAHISSNPLLARPLRADPHPEPEPEPEPEACEVARPQALVAYIATLRQTRAMDIDIVLPGHGEPIEDHAQLIDERLRLSERRAQKILKLIGERPCTAYELAQALWGNVAVTQAYLTLSEVLGHTDLLENDGFVREVVSDGVVRFVATGA